MAVNVKLKRSAVPGKIPLTTSLELGELALNTYDGCIYLKRDGINGQEIVKICGNVATDQFIVSDAFTGDGTTTQFTLTTAPLADQYCFITINGVAQHTDAYSLSGRTLTLSEAPVSGDAIEVRTISQQVGSVQLRDYKVYTYQPSSLTTNITGADIYTNVLTYDPGKVEVYVNGVRLVNGLDYTASNGNSVVLEVGVNSGDTVEVVSLAKAAFLDWDNIKPNNTFLTTTTASQTVDSFNASYYRTAKYLVSVSHATLGYHATEILVLHDGTNAYMTEYGTMWTQSSLGTFDASIVNGHVTLTFTPVNSNTQVNVQRITVSTIVSMIPYDPTSTATVYYYLATNEFTIENPNTNWEFSSTTSNTFNNTVSAIVPGPEANIVYLTYPGDPVFFQLASPLTLTTGVTLEWWQYTPDYGGGAAERIAAFSMCELNPKTVWDTGAYLLGSYIAGITYNNTYSGVWGISGPTGSSTLMITSNSLPTLNQWNHYALVYNHAATNGSLSLYVNGVYAAQVSGTTSAHKPTTLNYVQLLNSNHTTLTNTVNNNILVSAVRASVGLRYTAGFTPPQVLTEDGTTIFFTKFVKVQ